MIYWNFPQANGNVAKNIDMINFKLNKQKNVKKCEKMLKKMLKMLKNDMPVLGLAGCHWRQNWNSRYVTPASQSHISHECSPLRWAISCKHEIAPLHYLRREKREEKRKRRKFYIYPDVTHTHTPGRAGKTLKGKRKEKKADTRRANGQKQRRGGEGNRRTSGTNLHGETDLTKTAHTPKPHDTLRRGTRGKLGTKWGTSWWQTRKPKQLVKQQDSAPKT